VRWKGEEEKVKIGDKIRDSVFLAVTPMVVGMVIAVISIADALGLNILQAIGLVVGASLYGVGIAIFTDYSQS
jgi:hypothetical protein